MNISIDRVREGVFALNRRLGRFREVVWLVGDGRSGTSWLSSAIRTAAGFRTVFEPFHPEYVPLLRSYRPLPYVQPMAEDNRLTAFAAEVFSGRFALPRADVGNRRLRYNGLLIKDVLAHLFLAWADVQFPAVKKVLLLRHPFAVALSKKRLYRSDWVWTAEPTELLKHAALMEDHLAPFEDVIHDARGFFENQIVLWAVAHYVPFRQLTLDRIHLAFYEDLCADPVESTNNVLDAVGLPRILRKREEAIRKALRQPGSVSGASRGNRDLIGWWRNELNRQEIDRGIAILDRFGLADVYNDDLLPDHLAAMRLVGAPPV